MTDLVVKLGSSLVVEQDEGGGTILLVKKPAPTGCFDPHDYRTRTEDIDDSPWDDAFDRMFADINPGDTSDYRGATVILRDRFDYTFERPLIIDQSTRLVGQGGGNFSSVGTTKLVFDKGMGVWVRTRGVDVSRGSGSEIRDVQISCLPLDDILSYEHEMVCSVGDLVQFGHDREHVYEVVKVVGDAKTSSALSASGADAEWNASTSVTAGDIWVPSPAKQNGHKYLCLTGGTTGAVEPNMPIYGGWNWKSKALVADGTVVWEEDGIYQPHHQHQTARPFTDAQSEHVCWGASKRVEYNDIVRVVGDDAEFEKWLWNNSESGSGGVTGTEPPSLEGAVGSFVEDGDITWKIIDPVASGLLLIDGDVTFFPRAHPAIAIRAPGVHVQGCLLSGSTNDLIHIRGSASAPASNVNFWRLTRCFFASSGYGASGFQGGGGCVDVRGDDANGGCAQGCASGGAFPITQVLGVEACHGARDYSAAGSSWHGCAWNEALFGYAHDFGGGSQNTSIHGGYVEGGPSRFGPGVFIASLEGSASAPGAWTRDSAPIAPRWGRGVHGRAQHPSGSHDIVCNLAGRVSPRSNGYGTNALAFQAIGAGEAGEDAETSLAWKIPGWDTGWWGLVFGIDQNYGGAFGTFALTGDRAGASRDITSAGQFTIVRKRLGFGPPSTGSGPPFVIGYNDGVPTSGTWKKGDIVFYENPSPGGKIGASCTTAGSPGTWKEFGLIDT